MEEQLITFDTAKLAKEKGFDWFSRKLYADNGRQLLNTLPSKLKKDLKSKVLFTAPTQSLLQKWLREKHNLILTVDYLFDSTDGDYNVFTYSVESTIQKARNATKGVNIKCELFHSYEEALEKGLQEALKLIK